MPKFEAGDEVVNAAGRPRTITAVGERAYLYKNQNGSLAEHVAEHGYADSNWTKKPRELAKDQKWINGGGTYTVVGVCDGYVIYVRATHPDSGLYVSTEEEFRDDFTWISDV